jgi:hypothetical protein
MAVIWRKIGASPWLGSNFAGLPLALVGKSINPIGQSKQAVLRVRHARCGRHAAILFSLHSQREDGSS